MSHKSNGIRVARIKTCPFFPGWECKCKKITNTYVHTHTKKKLKQLVMHHDQIHHSISETRAYLYLKPIQNFLQWEKKRKGKNNDVRNFHYSNSMYSSSTVRRQYKQMPMQLWSIILFYNPALGPLLSPQLASCACFIYNGLLHLCGTNSCKRSFVLTKLISRSYWPRTKYQKD